MSGGGKKDPPGDLDLWREVTREIQPLSPKRQAPPATPQKPKATEAERPRCRPRETKGAEASRPRQVVTKDAAPQLSHGTSSGLDKRQGERLRKGRLPIEARLDLHGLHLGPAQRRLERFLADAQGQGKRCVLVITGKGRGEGGALRREVPSWLNRPDVRAMVVSFTYAQPKDGGEGALYILLKRKRP